MPERSPPFIPGRHDRPSVGPAFPAPGPSHDGASSSGGVPPKPWAVPGGGAVGGTFRGFIAGVSSAEDAPLPPLVDAMNCQSHPHGFPLFDPACYHGGGDREFAQVSRRDGQEYRPVREREATTRRGGEMVDAGDLKSPGGNPMWVRFPPPAFSCSALLVRVPQATYRTRALYRVGSARSLRAETPPALRFRESLIPAILPLPSPAVSGGGGIRGLALFGCAFGLVLGGIPASTLRSDPASFFSPRTLSG
jgi:hypothetical protein